MNVFNNEVYEVEKRMRQKEAQFGKEKAVLEQKVQLLKIELDERGGVVGILF
jgi:hypothetical protein